jgi:hypothetical protein
MQHQYAMLWQHMPVLYALTKENFANIDVVRIVGDSRTHPHS